jgi:hypothetical protein
MSQISKTGIIQGSQREKHWETVREAVSRHEVRPFCRAADSDGRMWAGKRPFQVHLVESEALEVEAFRSVALN